MCDENEKPLSRNYSEIRKKSERKYSINTHWPHIHQPSDYGALERLEPVLRLFVISSCFHHVLRACIFRTKTEGMPSLERLKETEKKNKSRNDDKTRRNLLRSFAYAHSMCIRSRRCRMDFTSRTMSPLTLYCAAHCLHKLWEILRNLHIVAEELKWNRIELMSRDFLPSSGARALAAVETKNEKKNVKRGTSRTQHLMDFCVKSVYARLESSARAMLTVYAFSFFFSLQYISKTYNCDSRRALRYGKLLALNVHCVELLLHVLTPFVRLSNGRQSVRKSVLFEIEIKKNIHTPSAR